MNVVDAVQVPYQAESGELERIAAWCRGEAGAVGVLITVADTYAGPGCWIISDVDGFTVMSPGRFSARYDEVTG